jgi:hypothetical protein
MDGERRHSLSDGQLNRELEAAFGIEPSPEFLARVRTRIASDPGSDVESGFSRIRRPSFEPLAAVAFAGIALAIIGPQMIGEETTPRPITIPRVADVSPRSVPRRPVGADLQRSITADLQVGHQLAERASNRRRDVSHLRSESPSTLPLQLSPVLIADDERRAFDFFIMAVSQGRVPEEVVKHSAESRVHTASAIEPLEILPLPPLARGAHEGEGEWE